jgi:uncharacterized membrane protein YeiH
MSGWISGARWYDAPARTRYQLPIFQMFPAPSIDLHAAIKTLVLTLDLVGTFVFALSGALGGARRRLDIFGVLVLSFVAANSGGIVRDLLIGATPPAAIADWRYLAVSLLAGVAVFFWSPAIERLRHPVQLFDAAGLALFCVAGAQKALVHGLQPAQAALLGMLTGIGGGVARDVLLSEVPAVLRSDIYAVAALAGAAVVVAGDALQLPSTPMALAGAALCFGLRMAAIRLGWHLPVARTPGQLEAGGGAGEDRNDR